MAENVTVVTETNDTPVEKLPGKFKTFVTNHKRKLVAAAVLAAAAGSAFVAGKKAGIAESLETGVNPELIIEGDNTTVTAPPAEEG